MCKIHKVCWLVTMTDQAVESDYSVVYHEDCPVTSGYKLGDISLGCVHCLGQFESSSLNHELVLFVTIVST